jgi:hypothetical protein
LFAASPPPHAEVATMGKRARAIAKRLVVVSTVIDSRIVGPEEGRAAPRQGRQSVILLAAGRWIPSICGSERVAGA